MKISILRSFERDFQKLPKETQQTTLKKLDYLKTCRGHPSLRTKKVKGSKGIWEGSITMDYRFTYHVEDNTICLRRVGLHPILKTP